MMMVDLVLEKLPQFVRPADIVGAIANEAQVGGSQIGKIWINKKKGMALVQIAEEAAQTVLKAMKSKKISGVEVMISLKDRQDDQRVLIRDYINKFKNLLYLERGEELVKYRQEMRHLTGEEREALGHAILNLRGRADSFPENDFHLVRFILQNAEDPLPEHRIGVGDMVIISKGVPLTEGNAWGTVVSIDANSIVVGFRGEPAFYVYSRGLRLDLAADDRIFQQTIETLKGLYQVDSAVERLRNILIGEEAPEWSNEEVEVTALHLDEEQQDALYRALKAQDLLLIGGGAGTGKTTIGVEILKESVKKGKKVLAVGTSATSRDVLAARLEENGLRVLRLHEVNLKDEPEYYAIHHLCKAIQKLMKRRDELTHPGGQWAEGLTYTDILEKAAIGRHHAGVPGYRLKEMAEWIQIQQKIDEKNAEINEHKDKIWARIFSDHDLICATHNEVGQLKGIYDLVVIDDAHSINEPEILPAYLKAKKVILIGDIMQIQPKVINGQAKVEGLDQSLFARLTEELEDEWKAHLKTQHRLPRTSWRCLKAICTCGNKLAVHEEDVVLEMNRWRTGPVAELLDDPSDLTFLDTSQIKVKEIRVADEEYGNRLEADLILEILQIGLTGTALQRAAVITFYDVQVQMIQENLRRNGIIFPSVYTADRFCGSEKDLVVVSLVHSNQIGYLGKSSSIPHLVTALTRARRKCIIIGDLTTFSGHPIYQQLLKEIRQWGRVYTL